MIKLFVLRHGQAEPYCSDDFGRQLTDIGKAQVESIKKNIDDLDLMAVSPFIRAQQTADLISSNIRIGKRLMSETLTPELRPQEVINWLEYADARSVLLVSHNPLAGRLVSELTGEHGIYFDTASLALLEGDIVAPGCMNLTWLKSAGEAD